MIQGLIHIVEQRHHRPNAKKNHATRHYHLRNEKNCIVRVCKGAWNCTFGYESGERVKHVEKALKLKVEDVVDDWHHQPSAAARTRKAHRPTSSNDMAFDVGEVSITAENKQLIYYLSILSTQRADTDSIEDEDVGRKPIVSVPTVI